MTRILGVGGLLIRSPDPDELYAWYSRCLGAAGTGAEAGGVTAEANMLCSIIDGEPPARETGRPDFSFKLVVSDVGVALRAIADEGGTVVGEGRTRDGMKLGWFIDPDGNRVELWQPNVN